jgi:DNA ligase (NAD+)
MLEAAGKWFASRFGNPSAEGRTFHPSQTCPECGSKLFKETGVEPTWRCPNLDCPAQIRGRLERWCSPAAMAIPGGDVALVARLVGKGLVRDVAELYQLEVDEIAAIEGMDKDSARKFFDAIQASQKAENWRVLSGLSIPHVGLEQAKSLCRHFASIDTVFAADAKRLMRADDIGQVIAESIVRWQGDRVNRRLIERLRKIGVNFQS